jgi:hypothetical protein
VWEVFRERDMRELSVGLGNAIAMAGYIIINEDDRKVTQTEVAEILARVEEKWNK